MTETFVELGGEKHALARPTIGRLEQIKAVLAKDDHPDALAQAVAILNACLAAPLTADTPARMDELRPAVKQALDHAGFGPGEPPAGASPAAA
jgi:hypothetical protein